MRAIGVNPTGYPLAPDTVGTAIITTAAAPVALDYPSGAQMVRFSSTGPFYPNHGSTGVNIPSTNSGGTTASSGQNILQPGGNQASPIYQIPGGSTGFSLTAPASGVITAEFWRK